MDLLEYFKRFFDSLILIDKMNSLKVIFVSFFTRSNKTLLLVYKEEQISFDLIGVFKLFKTYLVSSLINTLFVLFLIFMVGRKKAQDRKAQIGLRGHHAELMMHMKNRC